MKTQTKNSRRVSLWMLTGLSIALCAVACDTGTGGEEVEFTDEPGDCSIVLPSDTEVVTGADVNNNAGATALLCDGADYVNNSGSGLFFLEGNAKLSNNSANVTVWANDGADVASNSSRVAVTAESGATVSDNADTTRHACETITYDVSAISGGGCP